jgi:predicted metal-binding membrane protein
MAAATAATLALAAASCFVVVRRMQAMDMGVATELGSFAFFVGAWASMMAAMMLPGALPAIARLVRAGGRLRRVPVFVAWYVGIWTLVGVAVYAVYRPHGSDVAGALAIAAGVYELTPLKHACRRRCRESVGSGARFGINCVGSSIGLMAMLVAFGVMSITWMLLVAAIVLMQKVMPPRRSIDVPLAAAIVGLGILILVAPPAVPGLVQTM